ncbi:hypothetical protein K7X08_009035 [Anisodus acutangulus]|uniref:HMA domain-containing protein n=1 Tax=Anisodus acutangulus TaxID=402998 RepID=A0A9Q1RT42_9SOLA|nr:hypothetical protein K7X08_009035 [Anisodus acutangulus]
MESSLLTSPAAISRLASSRTLNNCNCSPLISQFHRHFSTRPTQLVLLSQLARLHLRAVSNGEVRGLNRFGPVSLSRSLVAANLRPIRKDLRSVSGSAASFAASGGGNDGSGGNGGGGGGGDGTTDGGKENPSVVAETGEDVSALSSDVIILDVSGMTCGGCSSSVKRILESLPQVSSATVNLTTETAIVWPVSEAKVVPNWQKELGEVLAKHLTTCGFKSNVRGEGAIEGDFPS